MSLPALTRAIKMERLIFRKSRSTAECIQIRYNLHGADDSLHIRRNETVGRIPRTGRIEPKRVFVTSIVISDRILSPGRADGENEERYHVKLF